MCKMFRLAACKANLKLYNKTFIEYNINYVCIRPQCPYSMAYDWSNPPSNPGIHDTCIS